MVPGIFFSWTEKPTSDCNKHKALLHLLSTLGGPGRRNGLMTSNPKAGGSAHCGDNWSSSPQLLLQAQGWLTVKEDDFLYFFQDPLTTLPSLLRLISPHGHINYYHLKFKEFSKKNWTSPNVLIPKEKELWKKYLSWCMNVKKFILAEKSCIIT